MLVCHSSPPWCEGAWVLSLLFKKNTTTVELRYIANWSVSNKMFTRYVDVIHYIYALISVRLAGKDLLYYTTEEVLLYVFRSSTVPEPFTLLL